jgi:mannose-6-phosphate isomerase
MELIQPVFKKYQWGSQTKLQDMFSVTKNGEKLAEAWFGSHKNGDNISKIYKSDLPYLFKVLAVEKCLSLQVHPDKLTAVKGFQSEQEKGLAIDSPTRVFKDSNSKPEMAVALSPFLVAVGVKSSKAQEKFELILENKANISVEQLDKITQKIQNRLKKAKPGELNNLLAEQAFLYARQDYPDDPTALLLLEMNVEKLHPGEAVYLPDGVIHAYIRGECLEIMKNSDNVFRAGLTNKYIDTNLVLRYTNFTPLASYQPDIINKTIYSTNYLPKDAGFGIMLVNCRAKNKIIDLTGPKIVLGLDGKFEINGQLVTRGQAFFVPNKEKICVNSLSKLGQGKFAIAHI